jgi:hypothetical protein
MPMSGSADYMQEYVSLRAGWKIRASGIWSLSKTTRFCEGRVRVPGIICGHPSGAVYGAPPSRGFVRQVYPSMVANSTPQWALTVKGAWLPTGKESRGGIWELRLLLASVAPHPMRTTPTAHAARVRRVRTVQVCGRARLEAIEVTRSKRDHMALPGHAHADERTGSPRQVEYSVP